MAIENLKAKGFFEAVLAHWRQGKPLLGICLGMQLLSSSGTEPVPTAGLGIIPGEVVHFEPSRECCVPHVGWNNVTSSRAHPIFKGIKPGVDFYFVHSYRFVPEQDADVLATTDYGGPFVSAVTRGSAVGFQFHPEKSQANGLKLLANFAAWDGTC
jgi:glutamine amidotransferase